MRIVCKDNLRDGVYCDFMTLAVCLLYGGIISIFVGHEERGFDVTAVGVLALSVEDLLVELDVVVVDGVIEGDGDHLGNVFRW